MISCIRRCFNVLCHVMQGEEPDNMAAIFEKELITLQLLQSHLPELMDKPIYNE